MERHLNDDRNGLEHGDESELAFGGYAPTVTSAPKRRCMGCFYVCFRKPCKFI